MNWLVQPAVLSVELGMQPELTVLPVEQGQTAEVGEKRQHQVWKVRESPAPPSQEEDFQSPLWGWKVLLLVAADSQGMPRPLQLVWKRVLVWSLGSGGEWILERRNSVPRWLFAVRLAV